MISYHLLFCFSVTCMNVIRDHNWETAFGEPFLRSRQSVISSFRKFNQLSEHPSHILHVQCVAAVLLRNGSLTRTTHPSFFMRPVPVLVGTSWQFAKLFMYTLKSFISKDASISKLISCNTIPRPSGFAAQSRIAENWITKLGSFSFIISSSWSLIFNLSIAKAGEASSWQTTIPYTPYSPEGCIS